MPGFTRSLLMRLPEVVQMTGVSRSSSIGGLVYEI